jgi:hypothetical protein
MRGTWRDRAIAYDARQRGEKPQRRATEQSYELRLSPLPVFAEMPAQEYRAFVSELVRDEERTVDASRAEAGKSAVLGVRRILEQDPLAAPDETARSPAPLVHAASMTVRDAFVATYRAFVDAFKLAAACLRDGFAADFPEGAFPPPAPFVGMQTAAASA